MYFFKYTTTSSGITTHNTNSTVASLSASIVPKAIALDKKVPDPQQQAETPDKPVAPQQQESPHPVQQQGERTTQTSRRKSKAQHDEISTKAVEDTSDHIVSVTKVSNNKSLADT